MSRDDVFAAPGAFPAPRRHRSGPAGGLPDTVVDDTVLVLPLLHRILGGRPARPAGPLAVPMLSEHRRDLWRLARAVLDLGEGADHDGPDTAVVAQRCRQLVDAAAHGLDDPRLRLASTALVARFAALTGDRDLCVDAAAVLAATQEDLVTLPGGAVVGPVGWFSAEVLHCLGRTADARAANDAALRISTRRCDLRWVARCRVQRLRVASVAASAAAVPAPAAQRDGAAGGPAATPGADPPQQLAGLSPRQSRILALAARGLTNAEIATELFVSVATVERHFTITYRALGVRNRAGALGKVADLLQGAGAERPGRP